MDGENTNDTLTDSGLLTVVQNEYFNNITQGDQIQSEDTVSNILTILLFSIGGVAFLLNSGILVSLLSITSGIRTKPLKQHFIAITTNDLLTSTATILMGTTEFYPVKNNPKLCAAVTIMFIISQLAPILTVLMIGIKRFIAVKNATRLRNSPTSKIEASWINIVSICGIWMFSVALYVAVFISLSVKTDHIESCYLQPLLGSNLQKFGALITVASFLTLAAVDIIYVVTICRLQRSMSRPVDVKHTQSDFNKKVSATSIKQSRTSVSSSIYEGRSKASTCSTSASENDNQERSLETIESIPEIEIETDKNERRSSQDLPDMTDNSSKTSIANVVFEKRLRKLQLRGVVTLGMVLLAVNISTLPFVMVGVLKAVIKVDLSKTLTVGINAFMSLNALLDPFVYCLRVDDVKQDLKNTLSKLCCICKMFRTGSKISESN